MVLRTNKSWTSKPPVSGSRINWSNPLTRGLLCAFPANEGGGVPRCAVTGPPLNSGVPAWTPSFSGRAPLITASPTVTTRVPFASTNVADLTLSCWAKIESSQTGPVFITAMCSTADNNPLVGLTHNPGNTAPGSFEGYFRNGALGIWRVIHDYNAFTINDGRWRHLACAFNQSSAFAIYIDGVRLTPLSTVGTWPVTGTTTVNGFCIGSLVRTTSNSYNVAVDQAMYWNRLLSDGEVASLYRNPWQIYAPPGGQWQPGVASGALTYYLWNSEIEEDFNVLTY